MLFAIGDIHGHIDKLTRLVALCRDYAGASSTAARFILLGDYVDRGPDSRGVLEFLAARPADVQAICGNHEQLMLEAVDSVEAFYLWLYNGGGETLMSYGAFQPFDIPAEHLEIARNLPFFIDDGIRLFVHAGIDPADPAARDPRTLLWTRTHPADDALLPRFVVHGHTPTQNRRPDFRPNRLNLDTGAGFGAVLTAAAFDDESPRPRAFIDHTGLLTQFQEPSPVRGMGGGAEGG